MHEREQHTEYLRFSDRWFMNEYFKHGSVEAAVSNNDYLPISIANFHKLIKRAGIIGSAGRHTSLPEVLHFFREAALAPEMPLEALYRTMPTTFKTSMVTLHRIYNNIEREIVRRRGVALIISPEGDPNRILVGQETHGGNRYKHAGDKTIPMGFAKKETEETTLESVLRILQQEVSVNKTIQGALRYQQQSDIVQYLSNEQMDPFVQVTILDVRVDVYRLILPEEFLTDLSSYKLYGFGFQTAQEIQLSDNLRPGVAEIVNIHDRGYLTSEEPVVSAINLSFLSS
ncbi:hypothetical protein KBA63_04805 [Candidatus Woesebacteria bacterium]|jgi:hypothetical protein|nr:hypothetical protein [Candidatus Woesebacteria bacterium]MBP9687159.1 hypothetical protein [Candidatus Woesebacteria bacterium]